MADSFTTCVLSSSSVIFYFLPSLHDFIVYPQPIGSLKNIWEVTALTAGVVNAVFPIFLSNNSIKLLWAEVWWDFLMLQFDLRLYSYAAGVQKWIWHRHRWQQDFACRILWRRKRRDPTKTVIQNKAGKKNTFLLSLLLEFKLLYSSWCFWGPRKSNYCLFLLRNECEKIKPDTFEWMQLWCVADIGEILHCLATEGVPIHFELLSHLFHGDAIAYESLIGTVAEVRKVIALMVSPEANKNYTKRFCSIWYQGLGALRGFSFLLLSL